MIEQAIRDRYFSLFRTCLAGSEETELSEAAELGRDLMLARVPLGEIAKMHEEVLLRLANEAPEMTLPDAARSTTAPLTQLMTAYDMEFPKWLQSHYQLITENITDIIWTLDMNLRPTYVSPFIEHLIGYTVKETMSLTLEEMLTPASFDTVMKAFEEELAIEKEGQKDLFRARTLELEVKRKDGSTVWTETKANFLRDQNGQLVELLGITRDITERKRAEEELRYKTEFLDSIINSASVGIFVIDNNVKYVFINPTAANILGYSYKDWIGKRAGGYIHPDDLKKSTSHLLKALHGEPTNYQARLKAANGSYRFLDINLAPVTREGKPHVIGIITDFTERQKAEEELRIFEKAFKTTQIGFTFSDKSRRILYTNPAEVEMHGYDTPEELIGKDVAILAPPELRRPMTVEEIKTFKRGERESVNVRKDGSSFPVYLRSDVVFDIKGNPLGVAMVCEDITERKQVEEKLRKSEENYRKLAESITDIFFAMDKDLIFTYWNKASEEMTGIKAEDALGKSFFEIFPDGEGTKRIVAIYRKVLKTQQSQTFVNEYAVHNINYVFEASVYPTQDGLAVFTKNITERKKMEEALRKSEEDYRLLVESAAEAISVIDGDGGFLLMNKSTAELFGGKPQDFIGKTLWDVFPKEVADERMAVISEILRSGQGQISEFSAPIQGVMHYFISSRQPIKDRSGKAKSVLILSTDITEQKRMEEELRAKEKLATMVEIAGDVAHEIKNPFFAISSGIQVLQHRLKLDEAQKETFEFVFQEIMRLDRLINQLLNFTVRLEAERAPLQITTLINEVIYLKQGLLQSRGVKIRKTLPKDMPPLNAEQDRIIQVLVNLVQNAIDVSQAGDTIAIACRIDTNKQCAVIAVKDRGPGIPESHREKVFDPFYSTKKGRPGIGLTISKKIVQDHGGKIWVEPRKKGGTAFVVELPFLRQGSGQVLRPRWPSGLRTRPRTSEVKRG